MPNQEDVLSLLRGEPVFQAIAEAERCAYRPIQLELLDSVLAGDHRKVGELLEELDHRQLLEDAFLLPLSVLLVATASPQVIKVFIDQGYDANSSPATLSSAVTSRMGDIALAICSRERQQALVEVGFMPATKWAYKGMADARPEVFDFWQQQHAQCEAAKRAESSASLSRRPSADLTVFRWQPDTHRIRQPSQDNPFRKELQRRLETQMDWFLDLNYPSQDEQQRWGQILANPFSVSCHHSDQDAVSMIAQMIRFQKNRTPSPKAAPIPQVDLRLGENARWCHALLESGFVLSDFQQDLASDILGYACATLTSLDRAAVVPESVGNLWRTVARQLKQSDPVRAAGIPSDMLGDVFSLSTWVAGIPDAERQAQGELLAMSVSTAPAKERPRSAPRL